MASAGIFEIYVALEWCWLLEGVLRISKLFPSLKYHFIFRISSFALYCLYLRKTCLALKYTSVCKILKYNPIRKNYLHRDTGSIVRGKSNQMRFHKDTDFISELMLTLISWWSLEMKTKLRSLFSRANQMIVYTAAAINITTRSANQAATYSQTEMQYLDTSNQYKFWTLHISLSIVNEMNNFWIVMLVYCNKYDRVDTDGQYLQTFADAREFRTWPPKPCVPAVCHRDQRRQTRRLSA